MENLGSTYFAGFIVFFFQAGTHWKQNLRAGKNCRHKSTDLLQMQKLRPRRTKRSVQGHPATTYNRKREKWNLRALRPQRLPLQTMPLANWICQASPHPQCYFQAFQSKVRFSRPPAPLGLQGLPPTLLHLSYNPIQRSWCSAGAGEIVSFFPSEFIFGV